MLQDKIPAFKGAEFETFGKADALSVALFGQSAQPWHAANPEWEGYMRESARIEQPLMLANIEAMNVEGDA